MTLFSQMQAGDTMCKCIGIKFNDGMVRYKNFCAQCSMAARPLEKQEEMFQFSNMISGFIAHANGENNEESKATVVMNFPQNGNEEGGYQVPS